ncbi:hypothetical protein ACIRL2_33825 [Embleya sp. NPDC127516]|uniref:oxidoreductase n=1 Tax=Embleya sp. NPDC127516 TaxID=3363990 RepID=UPI00382163EC
MSRCSASATCPCPGRRPSWICCTAPTGPSRSPRREEDREVPAAGALSRPRAAPAQPRGDGADDPARADDDTGVPTPITTEYYTRRAGAGLIVGEGIRPHRPGKGGPGVPGLTEPAQVEGWRRTTRAVHAAGSRIFAQLWHVGRVCHPEPPRRRAAGGPLRRRDLDRPACRPSHAV